MRILIIAGGSLPPLSLLKADYFNNKYIIAVDGGVKYCFDNKLKIDLAVGDFDSIDEATKDLMVEKNINKREFPADKDMTDFELALSMAVDMDANHITIWGATGSRLDHTMINVQPLKKYHRRGKQIKIVDRTNEIIYANESLEIDRNDKFYISIVPTDKKAIFSLRGVKWPLTRHEIEYGSSFTISNEIVEDKAKIDIEKGDIFIFLSRD